MRKVLVALLVLLFTSPFLIAWDGGNTIPCYACIENTLHTNRGYSVCMGCAMWRCYDTAEKAAFKGYMVYRCQHGHCILIPINSEYRSRDLNELILYKVDGTRASLSKDLIEKYSR